MKNIDDDRELRKLMKGVKLEKPDSGFESLVMQAVLAEAAHQKARASEPILGMKFWIFVGAFVAIAVVMVLFGGTESGNPSALSSGLLERFPAATLDEVKGGFSRLWSSISGLPVTLAIIMAASSFLILADKYFSSRHSYDVGLQ
ncbi:hypothetical protein BA6E_12440 [Bacteroidales bacterium 6E]|nr:hypothetical protein BA6E_12440 [Bacteroidales bacterium 6E]